MSLNDLPDSSGIYTLIISIAQPLRKEIGRIGKRDFALGLYTYTGSAIGWPMNLRARVSRHFASKKKRRWHIDYLLDSQDVVIQLVVFAETSLRKECQVVQSIRKLAEAQGGIKGFGSSDCHHGCGTHLNYFVNSNLQELTLRVVKVYEMVFCEPPFIHYS